MQPLDASGTPAACDKPLHVTQEILAEAAVWLARLHGPGRSQAMQRECLDWQARSAAHRLAFECCTDTWQEVAGVQRAQISASSAEVQALSAAGGRKGRRTVLVFAALGCAVALAVSLRHNDAYSTGVGEQRLIVLADGSRMTLNTSTDVRTKLTDTLRAVTVERGEALFEVAKDPSRPFVVSVSDARVVATGTAFLVRSTPLERTGGGFGVTLLEGQVIVQRLGGAVQSALTDTVVMTPGDRLRVGQASVENRRPAAAGAHVDRPSLDEVLAWKRGVAVLNDVSLADAIAEMNRYSRVQISLGDSDVLRALRVSGAFHTGDNEAFAQAVAALHGLVVRRRDGGLELADK